MQTEPWKLLSGCEECQEEYGSCKQFMKYDLVYSKLKKTSLRFAMSDRGFGEEDVDLFENEWFDWKRMCH